MSEKQSAIRFIIQIERPGEQLDMAKIRTLLDGTGVQIDSQYGPILINSKLGRYIVRGTASTQARAKAEQISGIRFFADTRQQPM